MTNFLFFKILILILLFQNCQSQTQKGFDLFYLKPSEKIDDILKANNLSLKDGESEALTLFGYDRFETSSEKLMLFDGISLAGKSMNNDNNNVILHYSLDDKIVSIYEVNLYSDEKTRILKNKINKNLGKPHHSSKNEDGLEMNVWKNEGTNVYYFLMSYTNEDGVRKTELTAIDMKNKRSNEWINFRSFNYYL